jgi:hypothetical protein
MLLLKFSKMRKIIAVAIMIVTFKNAIAQHSFSNSYKLGIHSIFFGTGDLRGLNLSAEYNRKLNNYLTFSPSIHMGYGRKAVGLRAVSSNQRKESGAVNFNLFASPMHFDKNKFRIGIGPSVRYTTGVVRTYVRPNGDIRSGNNLSLGYTLATEGEFNILGTWLVGLGGGYAVL